MTSIPRHELQALVKLVNSNQLLNRQLSSICQLNGLTSSGVKAALQSRIVNGESRLTFPACAQNLAFTHLCLRLYGFHCI